MTLIASHEELRNNKALARFLTEKDESFEELKKMSRIIYYLDQQTWSEYLMSPLARIKEIGVMNSAQNLVNQWQVKSEPEELKGQIDLEELNNSLAKLIPQLKQAE